MPEPAPRVRFAPSPTGFLHVGSARTALFNWLFARHTGGTLVLRIEDTDAERNRPELTDAIFDLLGWLGVDHDEGPFHQSERRDLYRASVEKLLADERAYLVDAEDQPVAGVALRDGQAVRFRTPDEGATAFTDLVRGEVSFEHANLEDFVIWRSNGNPTFLLANAVDDIDMGITHAIRGEDLLSSAPKVLLLARALGHEQVPIYAHLPLLVNEARQKLSKRRDDVAMGDYRDRGYLPEAMVNYLALLGWGPPDGVEVRPIGEIIDLFRLQDVNKAAAFFDLRKLDHVNAEHLRALSVEEFTARAQPWLDRTDLWPADRFDAAAFAALAPLVQERVRRLDEVPDWVGWLFVDEPVVDDASWQKAMVKGKAAPEILDHAVARFADCGWDADTLHAAVADIAVAVGMTNAEGKPQVGKAQAPIRVAVTGRTVGPPLFESLAVLGREATVGRLRTARARL
ncbi:glutamate--tRNA ligase [soil metagenome]